MRILGQLRYARILPLLASGLSAPSAPAMEIVQEKPHVRIPRVSRPPKLEDFINGTPREAEAVITGLRQFQPQDGAAVSAETTVYLSYDDKNIYAAYICKDDPAQIRAHMAKRDQMNNEDRVSLCLDTFNDHHRNYWFDANPYGCQQDGMTIDGVDDYNWDAVWYCEGRFTTDGYVILTTVPFKSIRFPSKPQQEWGFSVIRLIVRNNEMSCFPYISNNIVGWTAQFAQLDGIENISQGRNIQLVPYAMYSNSRYLDIPEEAPANFQHHQEGRIGLDAKMVLNDALTLDATARPDFSQVESDQPQVTVNQRYEVIYPEKRPFFLENANLFTTPTNLFFSRRIVDPRFGARLTGQTESWALGALLTDDAAPAEQSRGEQSEDTGPVPVPNHRAGIGVLRILREFGQDDRIGMLVTNRNLGRGFSRVAAVDSRLKLSSNWVLESQWMASETKRVDGSRFGGPACMAHLNWNDNNGFYSLLYEDRSAGFNTDLGYIDRVDIRRGTQTMGYYWRPNQGALLNFGPTLMTSGTVDRAGRKENWEVLPGFEMELTRQTHLRIEHSEAFEQYRAMDFRRQRSGISASSEIFPWLGFSLSANQGTGINYDPSTGQSPFLGHTSYYTAGLTLRPKPRLSFENSFIYSQLKTSTASGLTDIQPGTTVFINRILRSKWNYQFTRELSLRAIFDYNTLIPDQRLLADTITLDKRFGVDVLLTYFLHPGTAIYLGYSDLCRNLAYDPTQSPVLRQTNGIGLSTGTQAYLKISWMFRP